MPVSYTLGNESLHSNTFQCQLFILSLLYIEEVSGWLTKSIFQGLQVEDTNNKMSREETWWKDQKSVR